MGTAKQVIVLRSDLDMPPGKAASQAAHASVAWISRRLVLKARVTDGGTLADPPYESVASLYSAPEVEWLGGSFTKIVLQASLEDMMHVYYEAQDNGLEATLIVDEGRTVFDGIPTPTAIAIGPDYPERIDPITGALRLYPLCTTNTRLPGSSFSYRCSPLPGGASAETTAGASGGYQQRSCSTTLASPT